MQNENLIFTLTLQICEFKSHLKNKLKTLFSVIQHKNSIKFKFEFELFEPHEGEDVGVAEREVDLSAVKSFVVSERSELVEEKELSSVLPILDLRRNVHGPEIVGNRKPG